MSEKTYSLPMVEGNSYVSIRLDLYEPVEITDFAALFAGIGAQFDDYLAKYHPELRGQAKIYVREVRKGSTIADIFAQIKDLVGYMDSALIIIGFTALFSKRVRGLIQGQFVTDATKSDIGEIGETIRAVSHDTGGEMSIESVTYEDGLWKKKLEIKMSAPEARKALETLSRQKIALDKTERADHERVLMVFTRSDVFDAKLGKKSGELVIINDISSKPRPIMYSSEMAETRIKSEIRADESIYKKGFVVDVNVQLVNGNPSVYAITNFHSVLDLPDD